MTSRFSCARRAAFLLLPIFVLLPTWGWGTSRAEGLRLLAEARQARSQDNLPLAISTCQEAIRHFQQSSDARPELAEAHGEIALYCKLAKDWDRAIAYGQQSILLHEAAFGPDHPQTASAYSQLGMFYANLDDNDRSLQCQLKAHEILRAHYGPRHPRVLKSCNGLGAVYHNLRDSVRALNYYVMALQGYQAAGEDSTPGAIAVRHNLGIFYFDWKNWKMARHYWDIANAMDMANPKASASGYAERTVWIGEAWHEAGEYAEALERFNQAIRYLAPEAQISAQEPVPHVNLTGRRQQIFALAIVEKGVTLMARYPARREVGDLRAAMDCFDSYFLAMDSLRVGLHGTEGQLAALHDSYQYFERALETADLLYRHTGDSIWAEKALTLMERSKSNLLSAALRAAPASRYAGIPDSLVAHEKTLRHRIDALGLRIHELESEPAPISGDRMRVLRAELYHAQLALNDFLSGLSAHYPAYYQIRYGSAPATVQQIRDILPGKESAFIEYFVGDSSYFIYAITPTAVRFVRMPAKGLDTAVEALLQEFTPERAMAYQALMRYTASADRLWEMLLAPIAEVLSERGQLIVVPDGKLGHVPFEALLQPGSSATDYTSFATLPYLLNQYAVSYANSGTLLLAVPSSRTRRADLRMLAFAPSFEKGPGAFAAAGRGSFTELHNAPKEVDRISQFIPGDVYIGAEAKEEVFKQAGGNYNILHFATHGTIEDGNPLWSGIAFSTPSDTAEDGMLHTMELLGMDLNADLAVLSACNTGRGKILRGEGIMSLARGFMYAGCPSIVMSLWSVDDAAAAILMEGFYCQLSKGRDKDEALRQAKLEYIQTAGDRKAHPYYWAAHVLIGDRKGFGTPEEGTWWALAVLALVGGIVVVEMRKA